MVVDNDIAPSTDEVRHAADRPQTQLAVLVAADRTLFERHYDLIVLLRDAGRSAPELPAAYDARRTRADQVRRALFKTWPADAFRHGVDAAAAATSFAALCNVEVYRILTAERGLSPPGVEQWWLDSLTTLLLRQD